MNLFNQELNNDVWNFSPFQVATAQKIEQLAEFDTFLSIDYPANERLSPNHVRKPGPSVMIWYDTTGHLHAWRVGVKKILRQVSTD